jgi:hypothetical protein
VQADVVANLVHLRLFLCDWGSWARRHARLAALLREQLARHGANKTVSCQPFHALLYPPFTPDLALDVAQYVALPPYRHAAGGEHHDILRPLLQSVTVTQNNMR